MPLTLSTEVYRWQREGGWKTGRLVYPDTHNDDCAINDDFAITKYQGKTAKAYLDANDAVLVFDPLAEAPGLSFVPWGEIERYERGP